MRKNSLNFFGLIFFVAFSFISCGNNDVNNESAIIENRAASFLDEEADLKDELVFYSMAEDYKLSEEAVQNDIKSFLALKLIEEDDSQLDFSRAITIVENESEMKKVKTFSKSLAKYNTSSRNANAFEEVNISVYEITNDEGKELAVTSDDERIGSLLCLLEDVEYDDDVENPVLEIFLSNLDEYVENLSNEIESITEEDYELFKEKYNITDEEIAQAKAEYENAQNARKFWGPEAWSSWSICDINLNNLISKTKWDQGNPYNAAVVAMLGKNYPTGCGPTAVAQIMAYHEWPLSYGRSDLSELKNAWPLAADWDGTYDWAEMTANPYGNNLSDLSKVGVGALMYEVGMGCDAEYKKTGTSTTLSKMLSCLRNRGFSCDIAGFYNYKKISDSLHNNSPVIMFGKDKNATIGHFWIIDGSLKTERKRKYYVFWIPFTVTEEAKYVHCNYGWSGQDDEGTSYEYRGQGYYKSGVFETSNGNYNSSLTISTNIRPNK